MGNDELLSHPGSWPRFSQNDDLSGWDHDRIFLPDLRGQFHDVWPQLGLDDETVSRGIATGDVFGDGRLAIVFARQWSPSLFLKNVSSNVGRSLVLDLQVEGKVAGTRAAIGAEAKLTLADGRILSSVIDGGSGHSGKRAPEIHFGLGQVPENELFKVSLAWRDEDGAWDEVIEVPSGRHRIVLGAKECGASTFNFDQPSGLCRVLSNTKQ